MKILYTLILSVITGLMFPTIGVSQNEWPKTITASDGSLVKIYQWQPEAYTNDNLQANAAISVLSKSSNDPVFGMIWFNADASTQGQQLNVQSVNISEVKLPNEADQSKLDMLRNDIANAMTRWNLSLPLSEINNALKLDQEETRLASGFNNNPPKILYTSKPSLLIVIDGAPKLQMNSKWNVQTVVNTPFIIVKNNDSRFYLYGGKHWYIANAATGPFNLTTNVPSNLETIQADIAAANKENNVQQEDNDNIISNIIVSIEPAELLQSNGEPNFTSIPGTNLLYVKNSNNDIFMDVDGQQYYVLLSGRWYRSSALDGKWQYMASDKLPADFTKIPEGSAKDNVLASVAGTVAAKDAVMNAQVPQTAKVDRRSAKADIQYDGDPRFEDIEGTDMDYAVNTSGQVIRWRGNYYAVDNGVWFQSYSAMGPWSVAVERPYAVTYIPASYPVYGMKYVYVYDVTPDYVYMGYTPGYLNTYIYGPTVVYGTGYYYRPWWGRHYFARPYTWGFNMHYNPWTGWGFGFNYNWGWFNTGFGSYNSWGYWGGWWGPSIYRPSYCWNGYYGDHYNYGGYYGGYYGRRGGNTYIVNNVNIYRNNNIYNNRRDVVTRDNRRIGSYTRTPSSPGRYDNARPSVQRNAGMNNNSRPSVTRRDGSFDGGRSPRVSNGQPSNNGVISNQNGARPSRGFDRSAGNINNDGSANPRTTFPSRDNNIRNSEPVRRQLAEGNSQPVFNRSERAQAEQRQNNNGARMQQQRNFEQQRQQQPAQRGFEQPRQQQPVQRSFDQPRQQPAQQRSFDRPAGSNRSSGGDGGRSSRSSGGSAEGRVRRG
ncbi:MAG: hypothetical protein QM768_10800 [Agriterribacter sp.]